MTLKGSAVGGARGYTYEYCAKKTTSSSWYIIKNYSDRNSAEFKITSELSIHHLEHEDIILGRTNK